MMDRDYKESFYGSMFDELDRIQVNRVFSDEGLDKLAITNFLRAAGKGFQSLGANPKEFAGSISKAFQKGKGGLIEGGKEVIKTPEGKALAAGSVAAGGALGLANAQNPQQPGQVVVAR